MSMEGPVTRLACTPLAPQLTNADNQRHQPEIIMVSPPDRLNSWKEIAHYLGRDVRTTMRWERERGLPVHRVPGGRSRTVFAYARELDVWLAAGGDEAARPPEQAAEAAIGAAENPSVPTQDRAAPSRALVTASSVVVLVLAAIAIGVVARARAVAIDAIRFEGTTMAAFSEDARSLWRLPAPGLPPGSRLGAVVPRTEHADLDGDGVNDAVVAYNWTREHADDGGGVLAAVAAGGGVLWARSLEDGYSFGGKPYGPPWNAASTALARVDGQPRLALAAHHHTWWPAVLAVFDARGERRGTFVNAGWINDVAVSADGRHLLAGGVNNTMESAVLAVLDVGGIDGTSPPAWHGATPACHNCPKGSPAMYFAMEWSELSAAAGVSRGATTVRRLPSGDIQLRAIELTPADQTPELILELSPSFELQSASASDAFWSWHARLEREGRITHPASACPSRRPTVRVWSPAAGWRILR
jgi:hypothetical protein